MDNIYTKKILKNKKDKHMSRLNVAHGATNLLKWTGQEKTQCCILEGVCRDLDKQD